LHAPLPACLPIRLHVLLGLDTEHPHTHPAQFDMEDIRGRVDEFTPYVMVAIQESERMNNLLAEMKRSLAELDLGLKGDLTMTEPMERLMKVRTCVHACMRVFVCVRTLVPWPLASRCTS